MSKSKISKGDVTRFLLSDGQCLQDFVESLQDYLRKHMKYIKDGKRTSWFCNYDQNNRKKRINHFIKFCKKESFDWKAAYQFFERWCSCDCDYLYRLKVDDYGRVYVDPDSGYSHLYETPLKLNRKEVKTLKKRIYSRPVSVTLSDDMFRQIHEIAEKEEVSMSEVIRAAIQEQLMRASCSSLSNETLE